MRRTISKAAPPFAVLFFLLLLLPPAPAAGQGQGQEQKQTQTQKTFLIHLKTSLDKDDAQLCVAYNMVWAALKKGYRTEVLIDASALDTFKKGWTGKDDIEDYRIPKSLRAEIARQFGIPAAATPSTYGEYLKLLHREGAVFYVNRAYLIVAGIGTPEEPLKKASMPFFKPVSLAEMADIRARADYYLAY